MTSNSNVMYKNNKTVNNWLISKFGQKKSISTVSFLWLITIILAGLYDFLSIYNENDISILNKFISISLIISSFFWLIHSISYMDKLLKSVFVYDNNAHTYFSKLNDSISMPQVAVLIPVFNEEPQVVVSSLDACKQIDYPSFRIYILDDSTDKNINAKLSNISKNLNINYIHRLSRKGYKAGAINNAIDNLDDCIKYILIIDADHRVKPYILNELMPILENNALLSFIQTPQYFAQNTDNKISLIDSIQQHIFHKHICRGLDVNNTAILTGSNSIIRLEHLKSIGGISEECITEDIATSFQFQLHGYRGIFLDKIYAEGLPVPSLHAYFIQHTRWAYGTTQNFLEIMRNFIKRHGDLGIQQWREFFLNGSWYLFSGWAFVTSMLLINAALIVNFNLAILNISIISIINFFLVISSQSIILRRERNFHFIDLLLSEAAFYGSYFIYAQSSAYILFGKKLGFLVTPKTRGSTHNHISFTKIFPSLFLLAISIYSFIMYFFNATLGYQILFAAFWSIYNITLSAGFVFLFLNDLGLTQLKDWRTIISGK